MNDRDVLSRAASELRAAHTGRSEGAGFTRARIMNTLHQRRQRKLLRWAIFAPVVSALIGGSAWAQSNGQWPVIWQTLASAIGFNQTPEVTPHKPAESARPIPAAIPAPTPVATPAPVAAAPVAAPASAPAPVAAPAPAAAPVATPAPGPATAPSATLTSRSRTTPTSRSTPSNSPPAAPASTSTPAQASSPPPELASDPELAAFRSAHELHVAQNRPREAIDAFARYLQQFPSGRFVPEARYNTALNHVRLGEKAAARRALEPFAAGAYGDYRRREAQRLLEALR